MKRRATTSPVFFLSSTFLLLSGSAFQATSHDAAHGALWAFELGNALRITRKISIMRIPNLFHVSLATGDAQEHANKWVVLFLVALGGFMTTLDSSIVNIGLPAIAHTFGVGVSGAIEWIIIGYLIAIAAFLLTLGRLADMVGRKPIYEAGLVIFVLGSIFSGAAPSLAILIIARLFQGLGGAFIFSVNTAFASWSMTPIRGCRALLQTVHLYTSRSNLTTVAY